MLITLATRTFTPEPVATALRLGTLAHMLAAGGDKVRVLTSCLTLSVADDACRFADGGVDAGEDSGLVEVRRASVLRGRTGAVRGYVSYMSFGLPLIARLLAGPRLDVVVSEPPPTIGAAVRIACAAHRVPYICYCTGIVPDAAALAGVPGFIVCMVAGLEPFALHGTRRIIAVSDGVIRCVHDMGARDVAVIPNGVRVPEVVATGTPERFPTRDDSASVYAGTVAQWLTPEIFVNAFKHTRARLEGARLVFMGQGGRWSVLAERSRSMAGVRMIPAVSTEGADRWVAQATATLASLRPGGYDYACPTKILVSLAQGTPVIRAGPGQVARDTAEGELGVMCNLDTDEVVEVMVGLVSGTAAWVSAEGVRAWVSMHRSVEASLCAAATMVRLALA